MEDKKNDTVTSTTEIKRLLNSGPQEQDQIIRWPSDSSKNGWMLLAYDMVLCFIPIGLLIKVGLVVHAWMLDRYNSGIYIDMVHDITIYLIRFNSQLTTVFTVVFIMIVSTFVKRVALWKAQKGASIAVLEQWQASVSMTSTLKSIFSLRQYTLTSVGLVVIWAWYYLGSQASRWEYQLLDSIPARDQKLTYTNTLGPSGLEEDFFTQLTTLQKAQYNAQFTANANIKSAELERPYDASGALRIPTWSSFDDEKPDARGFYDCSASSKNFYTSNVGIAAYLRYNPYELRPRAIAGYVTSLVVGSFAFNTSYISIQCEPARIRNASEFPAGLIEPFMFSYNMIFPSAAIAPSETSPATPPASFEVWLRIDDAAISIPAISSSCNIANRAVEIEASCSAEGCTAKRIREVLDPKNPFNRSVFDDSTYAKRFLKELQLATGVPTNRSDTTLAGSAMYLEYDVATLNSTSPSTDSLIYAAKYRGNSLSQLFNDFQTVWQRARVDLVNGMENLGIYDGTMASPLLNVADFQGNHYEPHYALSVPWLVVDILSCTVLLLAAIAACLLRQRTFAPDVFGFVSSMTRDNPYIQLPEGGSMIGGMQRATHLRKLKVQFADVEADAEAGHVALVTASQIQKDSANNLSMLQKGRSYV